MAKLLTLGALVLFAALVWYGPAAEAALYWGSGIDIERVNADGSFSTTDFIHFEAGGICGVAVDQSHVYWTDLASGRIGRAGIDGENVEPNFIAPAGGPCGIVADDRFLYWANLGGDTIGRAHLDGSHVERKFIAAPRKPCAVAVNDRAIYWTSANEGVIRRTDIQGMNGPEVLVTGSGEPCGLALRGSHMFWTNSTFDAISRANLDGSEVVRDFIFGGEYPSAIVFDDNYLYWVNAGWDFESIGRARIDGTGVNQRFLDGLDHPYALAIDDVYGEPATAPPRELSNEFEIGRVKRNRRNGVVHVAIDLPAHGVLRAAVTGQQVRLAPAVLQNGRSLDAGRSWLKIVPIAPRKRRCGGRWTRRTRATLYLGFVEAGKEQVGRRRKFRLRSPVPRACKRKHLHTIAL